MGELDGKVAIVTGAGRLRGIGRATAVALAKLGANVVVTGTGRKPENFPPEEKDVHWKDVDSTVLQIEAEARRGLPVLMDVTNSTDVQMMMDETIKEFGRVDILVNNAAFARGADRVPILELSQDVFQKVVDVKVMGTYLCTKAVASKLIEQGSGGKVVNVSSSAGKSGSANTLAYNAACFAQIGMTQSMAHELGPHGINVNCVCPGLVDTSRMDDLDRFGIWRDMVAETPIRRAGTDEEVGEFISYLCTEAASWIHGQSININGGTTMEH